MNNLLKGISLTLATCVATASVNLSIPLAAHACGRFDLACKAREAAKKTRQVAYRTHPYYIAALASTRAAKGKGLIRGNDCREIVETGSWAGAGAALASGVGASISGLVRVVGKEAGNLMCSDAGM